MPKKTQNARILEHLLKGNSITPHEALFKFGCFRLSARIYELKSKGYTFSKEQMKNQHGNSFAKYTLIQDSGDNPE